MVNVVNNRGEVLAGRSGDDHFLSTSSEVGRSFLLRGVEACALKNDVDSEFAPRQLGSVRLSIDRDLLAINDDGVLGCLNGVLVLAELASETTLSRVILEKVSEHLRRSKVVDCYNLITLSLKHLTESQTANTTESVNCYFYHF